MQPIVRLLNGAASALPGIWFSSKYNHVAGNRTFSITFIYGIGCFINTAGESKGYRPVFVRHQKPNTIDISN